jgi:hypothetical protein
VAAAGLSGVSGGMARNQSALLDIARRRRKVATDNHRGIAWRRRLPATGKICHLAKQICKTEKAASALVKSTQNIGYRGLQYQLRETSGGS